MPIFRTFLKLVTKVCKDITGDPTSTGNVLAAKSGGGFEWVAPVSPAGSTGDVQLNVGGALGVGSVPVNVDPATGNMVASAKASVGGGIGDAPLTVYSSGNQGLIIDNIDGSQCRITMRRNGVDKFLFYNGGGSSDIEATAIGGKLSLGSHNGINLELDGVVNFLGGQVRMNNGSGSGGNHLYMDGAGLTARGGGGSGGGEWQMDAASLYNVGILATIFSTLEDGSGNCYFGGQVYTPNSTLDDGSGNAEFYGSIHVVDSYGGSDQDFALGYKSFTRSIRVISNTWRFADGSGNAMPLSAAGLTNPAGPVQIGSPLALPSYTVSSLPAGSQNDRAYASNGCKPGESSGSGTGVDVAYETSLATWCILNTLTPVSD